MHNLTARRFAVCVALLTGLARAAPAAEILIVDAKSQPESLTVARVGYFDLATGAEKLRWKLPGDSNVCNDFSVGPDKALYITDTFNGKIYKLPPGAATSELFLEDSALRGIDGITFLERTLHVNNVFTNKLYRIPVDATGKAGQPVEISLDQPVKGPDGMRAAKGKLLLAENGSGKISVITVNGDTASVTVIKEGLKTPNAVEPAGDTIWMAERGAGKAVSIPMPK